MVEKIAKTKRETFSVFFVLVNISRSNRVDRYTHLTQKPGIKGAVYPLWD